MKTLAKHLDTEWPKGFLREPKKFWRIDIECADFIWRSYCTEKPCFRNLFEIWAFEIDEALKKVAKCTDRFVQETWQCRAETAEALMKAFTLLSKATKGLSSDTYGNYDIEIQEEVLH